MNQRLQRLADQIQRALSVLIRDEINDPRLTGVCYDFWGKSQP